MKKLWKSIFIVVLTSIVIIIYFIGMYNYGKPVTLHKTFNEAILIPSNSKIAKKTTIEINAKIYKGVVEGLRITNRIRGEIMIDGTEYKFHGFSLKSNLNVILGFVNLNNQNNPLVFVFRIYDLNSIELISLGKGKLPDYRIFAPAKTIEDYKHKINNLRSKYIK